MLLLRKTVQGTLAGLRPNRNTTQAATLTSSNSTKMVLIGIEKKEVITRILEIIHTEEDEEEEIITMII